MAKSKQKEFEQAFRSELERHNDVLRDAIANLLQTPVPPEVKILLLETYSQWYSIPVHVFALAEQGGDATYSKKPFAGPLVVKKRKLVRDRVLDQQHYEDAGVDTVATGHKLIAKWIAEIWREAGGAEFPVPAYLAAHVDERFLDLRKGRRVSKMAKA